MRPRSPGLPGVPVSGIGGYTTYTPTITNGAGSFTGAAGAFVRAGALLNVWGVVQCTGAGSGALSISLPAGFTVVTTLGGFSVNVGIWTIAQPAAAAPTVLYAATTTTLGNVSTSTSNSTTYSWFAELIIA